MSSVKSQSKVRWWFLVTLSFAGNQSLLHLLRKSTFRTVRFFTLHQIFNKAFRVKALKNRLRQVTARVTINRLPADLHSHSSVFNDYRFCS